MLCLAVNEPNPITLRGVCVMAEGNFGRPQRRPGLRKMPQPRPPRRLASVEELPWALIVAPFQGEDQPTESTDAPAWTQARRARKAGSNTLSSFHEPRSG